MTWQEALAQIESPEFDASVNVVSGMKAFLRAVDKEPSVKEARRLLMESGDKEEALGRIFDLATTDIDPRYENPHDTPLAVLLWLTYYTAPEFANVAAHYTASAPNCWYANKLATEITTPPPVESRNFWIDVGGKDWNIAKSSATAASFNMIDTGAKFRFLPGAGPSRVISGNREHIVGEPS